MSIRASEQGRLRANLENLGELSWQALDSFHPEITPAARRKATTPVHPGTKFASISSLSEFVKEFTANVLAHLSTRCGRLLG
jgi:hypothetical protein